MFASRLRLLSVLLLGAASALPAGCGDETVGPRVPIKVMTYNLYLGSDLSRLITTTAADIPKAAASIFNNVQASDFPQRAKVLAALITAAAPDLVGLQEVSLYRKQVPSDFDPAAPAVNATEVAIDFLVLLMAEIDARGGGYRVVNEATNADAELPVDDGNGGLFDLRLTDRDVILAHDGVAVSGSTVATFTNRLALQVGGEQGGVVVDFARGYSTVSAELDGATFTFANSHLEIGAVEGIQIEQAKEVLAGLGAIAGPMILVGDFNSKPDGGPMNSYARLTRDFRDAYLAAPGILPGLTCCQGEDLKSPTSEAVERIDLLLYRGAFRAAEAQVIGSDPATGRTPEGLWASDHFGVAGTLSLSRQ